MCAASETWNERLRVRTWCKDGARFVSEEDLRARGGLVRSHDIPLPELPIAVKTTEPARSLAPRLLHPVALSPFKLAVLADLARLMGLNPQSSIQKGSNVLILDSRRVLHAAPEAGWDAKHISDHDVCPHFEKRG